MFGKRGHINICQDLRYWDKVLEQHSSDSSYPAESIGHVKASGCWFGGKICYEGTTALLCT